MSCVAKFGNGKTFTLEQMITKADGTLSAEVYCVMGMMDLDARKLHRRPARRPGVGRLRHHGDERLAVL